MRGVGPGGPFFTRPFSLALGLGYGALGRELSLEERNGGQYERRRGQDRDQGLLSHVEGSPLRDYTRELYPEAVWYPHTLMSLFAVKPLEALLKDAGHETLRRTLGTDPTGGAGDRRDHRRGTVFVDRHRCVGQRRTRGSAQLRAGVDRLRVRGVVLQRVLDHDPDRGQRVHLRVRHHGRADGVADRLGPGARIRGGRFHRGGELVALRDELFSGFRHPFPAATGGVSLRAGDAARHRDGHPGRDQPAGDVHRHGYIAAADRRDSGVGAHQCRHRGDQGDGGDRVHRAGLGVYQSREFHAVHSAEHRRNRSFRMERNFARRGPGVFRLHRIRRGVHRGAGSQETRRKTCPSGSSDRWRCAPFCMCCSRTC